VYFRDRLRAARYAALADSEGFDAICFALEELGLRLLGKQEALGDYFERLSSCAQHSVVLSELSLSAPRFFKPFWALFQIVRNARNDAMHMGAYARHATAAAIELCIGLEEALMNAHVRTVGDLMVKSPTTVEPWQPVAHARQLMLMHSFSYLPVYIAGRWRLLSELGLAHFLSGGTDRRKLRLGMSIEEAHSKDLFLIEVPTSSLLCPDQSVAEVLESVPPSGESRLWLVLDDAHPEYLAGVLSPFELI